MILDQEYRLLPAISNSSMKDFRNEGAKFYFDNYIDPMRMQPKEFSTESTDIGDLVDCLLTQREAFDTYYYISGGVKGSADLKAILDKTWQNVLNILTTPAPNMTILPYDEALKHPWLSDASQVRDYLVKTARTLETAEGKIGYRNNFKDDTLAEYLVREGGDYYSDLGVANGRKILDQVTYDTAVKAKDEVLTDDLIGPLFHIPYSDNCELKMQYMVTHVINDMLCKILLDYCLFDNDAKIIYPKDVKTAMSHKQFRINYDRYDYANQGSFYTGVLAKAFPTYKIEPFEFIVCCTQSGEAPMIYRMSQVELDTSRNGAVLKSGRVVQGWINTINEVKWHEERSNWQYPREYYEKGYVTMQTYNDNAIESVDDGSSESSIF